MPSTPTKRPRRASAPRLAPESPRRVSRHVRTVSANVAASAQARHKVLSSRSPASARPQSLGWPAQKVPVEIYAEIITYLPRSAVKNMRLVNHEFEEKASSVFFQNVVVPFRSEIYGVTPEPRKAGGSEPTVQDEMPQRSIMLQDKGMRVFQGLVCLYFITWPRSNLIM